MCDPKQSTLLYASPACYFNLFLLHPPRFLDMGVLNFTLTSPSSLRILPTARDQTWGSGFLVDISGRLIPAATSNYRTCTILRHLQITKAFFNSSNSAVFTYSLPGNGFSQWIFLCFIAHCYKSRSHYNRRSVGQSTLISSTLWGPR
jgi:hypothetical protein